MASSTSALLKKRPAPAAAVRLIEKGLVWSDFEALVKLLGLTHERLGELLGIPPATLYRRRKGGAFPSEESDHIMRFANLWWVAVDVFEHEDGARKWLKAPQIGLQGAVPLDYARTEAGAREVENLLRRIDYGVLA